jgi:hypothetical protein
LNYDRYINPAIAAVPPSGIRRFFDMASTMKDAISLGVGEPDFKTPYHIRNAAINSIVDGETQYTANRGLPELRREISLYLNGRFGIQYRPEDQILVTIGASEAIDIALRTLLSPGDEALVPEPSYVSYAPGVIFAGGTPVGVPTREEHSFRLQPEDLEACITPRTKLLILPYPNNPTGGIMGKEDLEAARAEVQLFRNTPAAADQRLGQEVPELLSQRDGIAVNVTDTLTIAALKDELHILAELLGGLIGQQTDQDKAHGDNDQKCQKHEQDTFHNVFCHIHNKFPPLIFFTDCGPLGTG